MKNKYGIEFADFYGDIEVASYPNPVIFGPRGGNRFTELQSTVRSANELIYGLNMPGGARKGRITGELE